MKSQCLNSSKVLILLDLPLVLYSTEIKVLHALKPCKRHAQTYPRNDKLMLPELKKKNLIIIPFFRESSPNVSFGMWVVFLRPIRHNSSSTDKSLLCHEARPWIPTIIQQ